MPAGQVPVWIPIVVGVIGVAGVLAGQFIGAWREDKRWTREWEREKARWQREDNDHWKEVRLDYYIKYIRIMNNMVIFTGFCDREATFRGRSQCRDLRSNERMPG